MYAPNVDSDRILFFKKLKTFISQNTTNDSTVLLCGDINCFQNRVHDKSVSKFKEITTFLDLKHVWLETHSFLNGYTWCNVNFLPTSRIDYVFFSNDYMYKLEKILVKRVPGTHSNGMRMTDHRLLKFCLIIYDSKRGPGYWKLNVSHLDNEDNKSGIADIIEQLDKWESFKRKVKDFSIYYAKITKKETGTLIRKIERNFIIILEGCYIRILQFDN